MDHKPYTDLITSQHRTSPRYMAWVRFLASLFDVDIGTQMVTLFDAHTAKGQQLDIIGELVGITRSFPPINTIPGFEKGLPDDTYRRLILAKIVRNHFKGQQGSLQNLWESVFESDILAVFKDNQDMTMDVELIGDYTPVDIALVLHGYIIPKPLGVGMKVNMTSRMDAKPLGAAATLTNSASIDILVFNEDPSPSHVHLYGGAAFGAFYGEITIGVQYANPETSVTKATAGVSPIVTSGSITFKNYTHQEAFHLTANVSCCSFIDANTACITFPSADMEGVVKSM